MAPHPRRRRGGRDGRGRGAGARHLTRERRHPHVAGTSRRYVLDAVRARTRKVPYQRGESSERDSEGRGVCSMSSSTSSQTSNCTSRRRRAPPRGDLPLPRQCPHLLRHVPHESCRVLAWTRWVRGRCGGKRAAGLLAAVGVQGRVVTPDGDAESMIANSTSGTKAGQSSASSPVTERRTSAMTPLTRATLLVLM